MAFYGGVLGIEHTRTQVSDQPYLARVTGLPGASLLIGFARVEGDEHVLEVIEYVGPKGKRAGSGFGRVGTAHTAWTVDDLPAAYGRLVQSGVRFLSEPCAVEDSCGSGWQGAFALDPDGLLIELIGPAGKGGHGRGRLTGLHHIQLTVSDLDAALEFLCGKLGLALMSRQEGESAYARHVGRLQDPYLRTAYVAIPNTRQPLELRQFRTPTGPTADPAPNNVGSGHLCLVVDDVRAMHRLLSARGVRFAGQPSEVTAGANKGAWAVYMVGPDDIRFELFQRP